LSANRKILVAPQSINFQLKFYFAGSKVRRLHRSGKSWHHISTCDLHNQHVLEIRE